MVEIDVGCPICQQVSRHQVSGHPCVLRCPVPSCQASFEYAGHCHLVTDLVSQARRLAGEGYPMPAYILSFTALEVFIEWLLVRKMLRDGARPGEVRRRLRRYQGIAARLGPLFRQVMGLSFPDALADGGADRRLVRAVHRFRETRNQVVHKGRAVTPAECEEALRVTAAVHEALVRMAARRGLLSR